MGHGIIYSVIGALAVMLLASLLVVSFGKRHQEAVVAQWCDKPTNIWQWCIAIFAGAFTLLAIAFLGIILISGIVYLAFL